MYVYTEDGVQRIRFVRSLGCNKKRKFMFILGEIWYPNAMQIFMPFTSELFRNRRIK